MLVLGSLIAGMGILPSAAMAEEGVEVAIPDSLSLEESIDYVMEHSESLALLDDKVELKEEALDEAWDQYKDYEDGVLNKDNIDNLKRALIRNQYYIKSAQADYDKALEDYEAEKEQTVYDATQKFYQLLLAQDNLESTETSYARAQDNLELANLRYKLGDATSLEVVQATNRVTEAYNGLQSNKESLHLKQMEWYLFLGLSYDDEVIPEGSWVELVAPDLTGLTDPSEFSGLVEATFAVESAVDNLELETIQYEAFVNIYHKVNKEYDQYKYEYDQATNSYNQTVNQAWLAVYGDYYSLMGKDRNYQESVASLEYQEELYRMQELKYSLGETSLDSLLDSEQSLYNAALQNNQQKMNLLLGTLAWQNQYQ